MLLVGAGKMSGLAASHLIKQGAESIAVRFEDMHSAAAEADIVITSTSTPDYIFRREDGYELIRLRKNQPIFFVDIAIPRDVDPEINRIEGVFAYDIDSLQSVSSSHREVRNREAERAEMIVAQEAIRYHQRAMALDIARAIRGLQKQWKASHRQN